MIRVIGYNDVRYFNDYTDAVMNLFYPLNEFKKDFYKKGLFLHSFRDLLVEYKIEIHKRTELIEKIAKDADNKFKCPLNENYMIERIKG